MILMSEFILWSFFLVKFIMFCRLYALVLMSVCEKTNINQFINIVIKVFKSSTNPVYLCKNTSISMSYLGVQDRFQIQMRSMEEFIDKENTVRFVDAFVEQLALKK